MLKSVIRMAAAACIAASWPVTAHGETSASTLAESARANELFERFFNEALHRSPMRMAQMGMREDYDKWDDVSDAETLRRVSAAVGNLAELRGAIDPGALDPQTQLSVRLFERNTQRAAESLRWRLHDYPVTQMFGVHTEVISFLINVHTVGNEKEARDYVARLHGLKAYLAGVETGLEARHARSVIPPRFVFPFAIESSEAIIRGSPFDEGPASPLWADFSAKIGRLEDVSAEVRESLLESGREALLGSVGPAYTSLIARLRSLEAVATEDDGIWKLPDGGAYYDYLLRGYTTTSLSAREIHEIGLRETARLHEEMRAIMRSVKFGSDDLGAFFHFMRTDPRFYLPNTDEGRAEYLSRSVAVIDAVRTRLDALFLTKPRADVIVKQVEAFREQGAAGAFYQRPTPDGSRPGIYYVNLFDVSSQPLFEMEALCFHEGIPGHHMQIAIAQELRGLPRFRRFGGQTVYTEGWALYSETLGKEVGFYTDPYSDFGRLAMELWRAARLVVDTGIHAMRWSRADAEAWLRQNTPNGEVDITREVDRYTVMPGQATAYMMGRLKIVELRQRASAELGARFDVRAFHDVILRNGAVPLEVLEELVDGWIRERSVASA